MFNAEQCDGLPGKYYPQPARHSELERREEAERVIDRYLSHGGLRLQNADQDRAYYMPKTDVITLPLASQFEDTNGYYSTLFHECGHSTGHESRLHRPGIARLDHFGSDEYSAEELVAEMTSAMLSARTGIEGQFDQSASYLGSWLGVLRNDRKPVATAASQADKAADLIAEDAQATVNRQAAA